LSPEEIRAISKTVRRNIIFIEKIISKRKTYIYVEFLDKNRNKYVRVYEEKIKVSSLIFSNKLDLNGKQIKSDIGETKERRNVLNYLGLN
jgi:hypothetical protein